MKRVITKAALLTFLVPAALVFALAGCGGGGGAGSAGASSGGGSFAGSGSSGSPVAIAMPYTGRNYSSYGYYVYTTTGLVSSITLGGLSSNVDIAIFSDANFTMPAGWACTMNTGTMDDVCSTGTPVPANTTLYILSSGYNTPFTLSVNAPQSGAPSAPVTISATPYSGQVFNRTDGFYSYTATGTTGLISASSPMDEVVPVVYTDATFSTVDANWSCRSLIALAPSSCAATTAVPTGTILHIRAKNYAVGGSTFTLSLSAPLASQGAANAPVLLSAVPYGGQVGRTGNGYYSYTTVGSVDAIRVTNQIDSVELSVFTSNTFFNFDPNWTCTHNILTDSNGCSATTAVPANTVLYIQAVNLTAYGSTYTLDVFSTGPTGALGAPAPIPALPFNGKTIGTANSYYTFTTPAALGQITMTNKTGRIDPTVYMDTSFTTVDRNWTCANWASLSPATCTATTTVPAGSVVYIKATNYNLSGATATFTLQ